MRIDLTLEPGRKMDIDGLRMWHPEGGEASDLARAGGHELGVGHVGGVDVEVLCMKSGPSERPFRAFLVRLHAGRLEHRF